MGQFIDLTGQKPGRLTVIKRAENDKYKHARWLCQCICGNYCTVLSYSLICGDTQSCGCLQKERARDVNYIHGHSSNGIISKTYWTWNNMLRRCSDDNNQDYKNYGGRGIKVCKKWWKFGGFLQDMGERPPGLTLDRIDNNNDYCKENCRWATTKEQSRNYRRNKLITINGVTKCLVEWCEIYQKPYKKTWDRINRYHWTPEEALELTPRRRKTKEK